MSNTKELIKKWKENCNVSEDHVFIKQLRKNEITNKIFGVDFNVLKSPSQNRAASTARQVLTFLLYTNYKINPQRSAEFFGRHRTTGYYMLIQGLEACRKEYPNIGPDIAELFDPINYCISQCRNCDHAESAPASSHHLQCSFFKKVLGNEMTFISAFMPNAIELMPMGDSHGIKNGWYMFPINYDPVWMRSICKFYQVKL